MTAEPASAQTEPPLTTGQVAQLYKVDRVTVRRWAEDGLLPHFKTPRGQLRFHVADIERLIEAQPTSQSA